MLPQQRCRGKGEKMKKWSRADWNRYYDERFGRLEARVKALETCLEYPPPPEKNNAEGSGKSGI
jgi:hypothetical protein